MTNEEKAKEISAKYGFSKLIPTDEECIAYNAAMEMAEWKDRQFAELLNSLPTSIKDLIKTLAK